MADVKSIADKLGYKQARTYLASGNLLFTSTMPREHVRETLEKSLSEHLGRSIKVVVRTDDEIAAVVRSNPFTDAAPAAVQTFFLDDEPPENLLDTVRNKDDERIAVGTREIFVAYGEKGIGRSRLRIAAADAGTARNMKTVSKLAELAREMS